jgi:hypothetical protein
MKMFSLFHVTLFAAAALMLLPNVRVDAFGGVSVSQRSLTASCRTSSISGAQFWSNGKFATSPSCVTPRQGASPTKLSMGLFDGFTDMLKKFNTKASASHILIKASLIERVLCYIPYRQSITSVLLFFFTLRSALTYFVNFFFRFTSIIINDY